MEREPGSGIWWIRYRDADGKLRREKVGSRSAAKPFWTSAVERCGVIRFLKKDEEALVRQIIQERFPEKMPELDVAIGTCMRADEQFGPRLTWGQVDFDRSETTLKQTQNGTSRVIPLNVAVVSTAIERLIRALILAEIEREKRGIQPSYEQTEITACRLILVNLLRPIVTGKYTSVETFDLPAQPGSSDDVAINDLTC